MYFNGIEHTTGLFQKIKFFVVYGRYFFLLIHFVVEEDYQLPKITSHVLSVPLNVQCVRILS